MRIDKARQVSAVFAVGALALTAACSSGGASDGGKSPGTGKQASVQNFGVGTKADSTGPAVAVDGAKSGGTAYSLDQAGFDYLDPGQQYISDQLSVQLLYNRSLTGYKIDPKTGKTIVVGDLATDSGTPSDGSKTWTYTLKDGLKFEDGTPVTAKDIKYGIERLFADYETQGPQYVQKWIYGPDYRKKYAGPYDGKEIPDSLISTPDDKTIVFHFLQPHADTPYAMAMPNISPVPKAKDDRQKYNNHPVSTGPYKIASYQPGKSLSFVRNTNWDPKTDPIRNAYPDKWEFQLGIQEPGLTNRLAADTGTDKYAISMAQSADPSKMQTLTSDPQYKSRTVNEYQPYVEVFNLNSKRITNPKVRQALQYAFPLQQVQQAMGGGAQGDLGTSLLSPTVAGYKKFDPFGKLAKPMGDPEKSLQLLKDAGVTTPYKISLAYANTPKWDTVTLTIQKALEKAGFQVDRKAIDPTSYYTVVGKVNTPYDMYRASWGADWPNGSTVVPPTMDGRNLVDGTNNYSFLNDPKVNSEIDRINQITDLPKQAAAWEQLSEYALQTDASQIPFLFDKYFHLYGSGLGGVTYNQVYGTINPNSIYVKQ